jgi:hypothetical protein
MNEFLNEDKKPFSELSPEEMHCVVTNKCDVYQPALTSGYWVEADHEVRNMISIYRTKPVKKLVVPWDALKPEYFCAAKNKNGSIFAFRKTPRKKQECWLTDDCVTVSLYPFVGVESDGVDWETSLTFRDGAK